MIVYSLIRDNPEGVGRFQLFSTKDLAGGHGETLGGGGQ